MENSSGTMIKQSSDDEQQIELPPGFRFHPTDEELITHYLSPKFLDARFNAAAMGEVDLNKVEPWDLPRRAKMGEKEWYFFCVRDRKYPTGIRTNRATEAGYWKATGKDKEIYRAKALVGMKKTLVFYTGRAPKGQKTNWVTHEYRLAGNYPNHNLPRTSKNDWVICRVFNKDSNGNRMLQNPESVGMDSYGSGIQDELRQRLLPPLMESSPYSNGECGRDEWARNLYPHVTRFSATVAVKDSRKTLQQGGSTQSGGGGGGYHALAAPSSSLFADSSSSYHFLMGDLAYPEPPLLAQDDSILRLLLDGNDGESGFGGGIAAEQSQDTTAVTGGGGDMNTDMSSGTVSYHEMAQRPFEGVESYRQENSHLDHHDGPVDLDGLLYY